eukprot:scaffold4348_cov135-Isochrysis_galbana.AAC.5
MEGHPAQVRRFGIILVATLGGRYHHHQMGGRRAASGPFFVTEPFDCAWKPWPAMAKAWRTGEAAELRIAD